MSEEARGLAAVAPPAVKLRPAESLERARFGEVIFIDGDGSVMGAGKARRRIAAAWASAGAMIGAATAALGVVTHSAALAGAYLSVIVALTAWRTRHGRALRQGVALIALGRTEEARQVLHTLEARPLLPGQRTMVERLLGAVAWLEGAHPEAAQRFERAMTCAGAIRQKTARSGAYWLCAFPRVQVLAAGGEVDAARKLLGELRGEPPGDFFHMQRMAAELSVAFHGGDASRLPGDADLYEWAKTVLRTNRFGAMAVLLAWAFTERGDLDMAQHMLDEAPARLEGEHLDKSMPRLHEWLAAAKEARPVTS
jgi:hypothetical protein